MPFDPDKPYGRVRGIPGAVYEQGGQLYNRQGEPFKDPDQPVAGGSDATEAAPAPEPAPAKAKAKAKPKNQSATPDGVRPMREQAKGDA